MRTFIESLKRLYGKNLITDDELNQRLLDGKISTDELEYIKDVSSMTEDLEKYYEKTQAIPPSGGDRE